ncbi:MAG TPA: hypothetical protein VFN48_09560 [Solirubrobacteraceae bacterium]|nr:hypothetical protein [Solirubrobacteraceae bacterium]
MVSFAVDWATLSSLGTALGTLVLAVATFASVRAGARAARISEAALEEQRRPVLTHSRLDDPRQKMMFVDQHWVVTDGGRATAEHLNDTIYLALSLRNVGSGMAVCQGWTVDPHFALNESTPHHAPLEHFRTQARDIYVPAGDIGMWQGALRDPDDPVRAVLAEAIDNAQAISIELLYSDLVGRQRTVTRFGLFPSADGWYPSMSRHWHLDSDGPRPEQHIHQASEQIRNHLEASGQLEPGADRGGRARPDDVADIADPKR